MLGYKDAVIIIGVNLPSTHSLSRGGVTRNVQGSMSKRRPRRSPAAKTNLNV